MLALQSAGAAGCIPMPYTPTSIEVHGARHAGIEATDGTQDIDASELLRPLELLQQRGVQHRLLIRSWDAEGVEWRGHPCRGRDDLIVGDAPAIQHRMVRQRS